MNLRNQWKLVLLPSLLFFSCKTTTDAHVKADYVEYSPNSRETWTEVRIRALNDYAKDMLQYDDTKDNQRNELERELKDSFAAAGVTAYDPLNTYSLRVGNYGECFGAGTRDYGIYWDSQRDAVKKQLEEAAYFIRDYHYAMLGRGGGAFSFREVIICPEAKVGGKMLLEGYKLYVGIPFGYTNYKPIPNGGSSKPTLKSLWADGSPIGLENTGKGVMSFLRGSLGWGDERAKNGMLLVWKFFNPLSTTRQALRKVLHDNRGTMIPAIQRLMSGQPVDANPLRQGLISLAFPESSAESTTTLAALTAPQLVEVARNWICGLSDPQTIGDLESDAMAIAQSIIKKTYVEHDVAAGLVAVENHHDVNINVLVAMGTGRFTRFIDSPVNKEFTVKSKVRGGLVAVSTSDNITVDLSFYQSTGSAMRRATFEEALNAAKSGRSLCRGR
jgi:hypothetical protein